jgi:hypothetical protein
VNGLWSRSRKPGAYIIQHYHPADHRPTRLLRNGRPDIVNRVLETHPPQYTRLGLYQFADHALHVGAGETPQVASPFVVHLLEPSRRCVKVPLDGREQSGLDVLAGALSRAGLADD